VTLPVVRPGQPRALLVRKNSLASIAKKTNPDGRFFDVPIQVNESISHRRIRNHGLTPSNRPTGPVLSLGSTAIRQDATHPNGMRRDLMQHITIALPAELSAALASLGQDLSRSAFEALALTAYPERKITAQLRQLLG
jgi:hypothetical protein